MRQPGIAQELAGLAVIVLMDENPARQSANRSVEDAHILVEHQMMDVGAIEERTDRRNQHDIVGSNQFPHLAFSFIPARLTTCCYLTALPRQSALSMVISEDVAG
jgi:hypothetical protein